MPPGQLSGLLPCLSREKRPPPVSTSVKAFRHFIDGSLALASLDRACRNLVPAFPQRSPPRLLPAAACGGLRPAPDCRPRRALLHLSYSSAPFYADGAFVTHGRVEVWRSGCRLNISVAAPFVWRCLTGSTVAPFPHPAHRTGHADLPHPALGQDVTPSPTTGPDQAVRGVRAGSARKGARVDSSRPCVA